MDIRATNFFKVDKTAGVFEHILLIIDQFMRYTKACTNTYKSAKNTTKNFAMILCWNLERKNWILYDPVREFEKKLFDVLEKCNGVVLEIYKFHWPQEGLNCESLANDVLSTRPSQFEAWLEVEVSQY